jgi:hypothetical protein
LRRLDLPDFPRQRRNPIPTQGNALGLLETKIKRRPKK